MTDNPLRFFAIALLIIGISYPVSGQVNALQEGKRHYQSGDFQQAIESLRTALGSDSTNRQAYVLLSHSYLQVENHLMADLTAEEGLDRFPETVELRWIRAEALTNREQFADAIEIYQQLYRDMAFAEKSFGGIAISGNQLRRRLGTLHQALGIQHVRQSDTTRAIRQFDKALSYIPDSLRVYQNLGYLQLKTGHPDKANAVADSGLARDSTHVPLLQIKAQALYTKEEYQALLEIYQRLYRLRPEDLDIALAYGEVLVANQQVRKAQKHYESLLNTYPDNRKIYEALVRLSARGMNYRGKIGVLKKMRKQFPGDSSVVRRLAETYTTIREWQKARASYDTLRMMTADSLEIGLSVGRTYELQDSLNAAARYYNDLYERYPESVRVVKRYGEVLESQQRWQQALEVYQNYLSLEQNGYGYRHLGWNYEQTGRLGKAGSAYRRSLEFGAPHPLPLYRLARMVREDGNVDSSLVLARKAIRRSLEKLAEQQRAIQKDLQALQQGGRLSGSYETRQKMEDYNQLAEDVFAFLSDSFPLKQSEPVITGLLEDYPDSGRLYYLTGRYYRDHDRTDAAIDRLTKAIRISSNLTDAHLMLGEIYENRGNFMKAIPAFRRVLSLDSENVRAFRALLRIHEKQGELDRLCDRWLAQYRANSRNSVLREHLIEALHKAGRYEEAKAITEHMEY